jgi:hypothetical protein
MVRIGAVAYSCQQESARHGERVAFERCHKRESPTAAFSAEAYIDAFEAAAVSQALRTLIGVVDGRPQVSTG